MPDEIVAPEGWEQRGQTLHRELAFADFAEAWAFMNRVAEAAEEMDHHPDWSNSWNKVVIDLSSHDEGRLTERDVALANRINEILAEQ